MKGTFVIIVGPSTSGKTEMVKALLARMPNATRFISTTTRDMRPEEKNGVDYMFTNREDFERRREAGEFFEYAEVYGNLYGSSKKVLDEELSKHDIVFAVIDIQGAQTIKKIMPESFIIFLNPGPIEVVHERMKRIRSDISEEQMAKRMETAQQELALADMFDAKVENREGHFEEAVAEMERILLKIKSTI